MRESWQRSLTGRGATQLELFEEAPVAFLVLDRDGLVVDANREAAQLLGCAAEELPGRTFSECLAEGQRAEFGEWIRDSLERESPREFEASLLAGAAGEPPSVCLRGVRLPLRDGTPVLYLTACHDVTALRQGERRRSEREKIRLVDELRRKNAELEQFTYAVSHDLKSPLHTIKGFVEIMQHDLSTGRSASLASDLARVKDAADRMQELLDVILSLSRIGRVIGPKEAHALGPIVAEVLTLLDARIRDKGVRVVRQESYPSVCCDRVRLREVLQNLVENAVKFMGEQAAPVVEISAQECDGEVRVSVRDNGSGIRERDRERIFELFRKGDHRVPGAGVGLALARRIVDVHGGRIWAESEGPGCGAVFHFVLPAPDRRPAP